MPHRFSARLADEATFFCLKIDRYLHEKLRIFSRIYESSSLSILGTCVIFFALLSFFVVRKLFVLLVWNHNEKDPRGQGENMEMSFEKTALKVMRDLSEACGYYTTSLQKEKVEEALKEILFLYEMLKQKMEKAD